MVLSPQHLEEARTRARRAKPMTEGVRRKVVALFVAQDQLRGSAPPSDVRRFERTASVDGSGVEWRARVLVPDALVALERCMLAEIDVSPVTRSTIVGAAERARGGAETPDDCAALLWTLADELREMPASEAERPYLDLAAFLSDQAVLGPDWWAAAVAQEMGADSLEIQLLEQGEMSQAEAVEIARLIGISPEDGLEELAWPTLVGGAALVPDEVAASARTE